MVDRANHWQRDCYKTGNRQSRARPHVLHDNGSFPMAYFHWRIQLPIFCPVSPTDPHIFFSFPFIVSPRQRILEENLRRLWKKEEQLRTKEEQVRQKELLLLSASERGVRGAYGEEDAVGGEDRTPPR